MRKTWTRLLVPFEAAMGAGRKLGGERRRGRTETTTGHAFASRVSSATAILALVAMLLASPLDTGRAGATENRWTSYGPFGGQTTALAIDPNDAATLYAGTGHAVSDGAVFKTTNGGSTWSAINNGFPDGGVAALAVDPQHGATVWAGTNDGVFKTTTGGSSWTAVNNGLQSNPNYDFELRVVALVIDPKASATAYVATWRGVFKTTDGGSSWTQIGDFGDIVDALAIDPQTPTTLYAGDEYDVHKSVDGGATWSTSSVGLPIHGGVNALAVDPQNPTTVYVALAQHNYHPYVPLVGSVNSPDHESVYKTTDGGRVWSPAGKGVGHVADLEVSPTAPSTLFATGGGEIYRSNDGAATWTSVSSGFNCWCDSAFVIDPTTPAIVYGGSGGGVSKSTDGGSSWTIANTGITATHVNALAVSPAAPDLVYASTLEGLYKSTDRGRTWELLNYPAFPSETLAVDPQTPTTIYAGDYKSTDGGTTWVVMTATVDGETFCPCGVRAIDPTAPSTMYVTPRHPRGVWATLHKTTDAGASWTEANNGLPPYNTTALAIDPKSPATVYAGTGGVYKTTDGGGSWTATGLSDAGIGHFAIDPKTPTTLYAAGSRPCPSCSNEREVGVFKTTDGGTSWTTVSTGLRGVPDDYGITALAIDPQTPTTLYAGICGDGCGIAGLRFEPDGGVFRTTTGGSTWTVMDDGLTNSDVTDVVVSPDGSTVYAGTWGGGVFVFTGGSGDTTAPDTTITAAPSSPTNSTDASFSFSATEPGSTFDCRLDGAAFAACASPKTYSGLADGSHTFAVRATDGTGNTDGTPASLTWTLDTTAPGAPTLLSPANGSKTTDGKPTFDWSDVADPSGVTYHIQVDGEGSSFPSPEIDRNGLGASTFTATGPLAPATYSWRVRTIDGAGNTGAWSTVFTLTRRSNKDR